MYLAQAIGTLSFIFLLASIFWMRGRYRWPMPSDFFLFFMILTWSPLAFFPLAETHIKDYLIPEEVQWRFAFIYALMCLFIPIGFSLSTFYYSEKLRYSPIKSRPFSAKDNHSFENIVLASSLLLIALYLTSNQSRAHLSDIFSYISSSSILSYNELRREVTHDGLVMSELHPRLQYSIISFLFCCLIFISCRKKSIKKFIYLAIAITLFLVCAATLKKRPYLYYFVLAGSTFIAYKITQGMKIRKAAFIAAGVAIAAPILMLLLYSVQYRENSEKSAFASNVNTLVFRALEAYPAGAKLYVDIYPDGVPFTYGRSIGILQPLIGSVEQPYSVVPAYFGQDQTTFPSGYLSYAYSDFGFFGVIFFSLLVGMLLKFLNIFSYRRKFIETKIIGSLVIGLSTSYLCNKSLSAALLSGGLLLVPIVIFSVEKLLTLRLGKSD